MIYSFCDTSGIPCVWNELDGLQPPGLAFFAFFLGPGNRFPIRRQNEPRAGIGDFDTIAARLIDIEEEGLLHRMFMRAGFDEHAIFEENVGGEQHFLPAIERVGDMVETSARTGVVARVGEIVSLVGGGHPDSGLAAVIHHDALGETEAEIVFKEFTARRNIGGQAIPMVEPAHIAAARRKALRLIFQGRLQLGRRFVPFGVVVEFYHMPVGVLADEGFAVTEIAVGPADIEARAFQSGRAPLERLW